MQQVLDALLGEFFFAGYHIPVIAIVAGGFFLWAALVRNIWLAVFAGFVLFFFYIFLPALDFELPTLSQ